MTRKVDLLKPLLLLLLIHRREDGTFAGKMEDRFEKCCGLGTSWAKEGLRCERFSGPVSGVPRVEQGLCLEAVDICCVRAYHEQQCEKGKSDARQGLACVSSTASKTPGRGDYHRDCCEGCKLGILTGSMGQGCAFKTFNFGIPWDPAFMECCQEALPSTTTDENAWSSDITESEPSSVSTSSSSSDSSSSSSSSPSSPSSSSSDPSSSSPSSSSSSSSDPSSSSPSSPSSSSSDPSSSSPSSSSSSPSDSSSSSVSPSSSSSPSYSSSPSLSSVSSSDSSSFSATSSTLPTPKLDDICQLMKGMLCSDICVPTPGSYHCACRDGFTLLEDGKTCRQDLPSDRCKTAENPCEHRCTDTGSAVVCSCDSGYVLDADKRSCNLDPTSETTQDDRDNELDPRCPAGYRYNKTSQVCDDVDECLEDENICAGQCKNTIGSYTCQSSKKSKESYETCPPGYQWNPDVESCTDIDECSTTVEICADGNRFCLNTQGSYECLEMIGGKTCPAGFKYDATLRLCKDVDECAEGIHGCLPEEEECRNTEGAYECDLKCEKGFTRDTVTDVCTDVNECAELPNPCPRVGTLCVNTIGSFECVDSTFSCPAGYKPDNDTSARCVDVDECLEKLHSCSADERCVNEIGSYRCEREKEKEKEKEKETTVKEVYAMKKSTTLEKSNNFTEPIVCDYGYTFDVDTKLCKDIDECASGIATCGIGERCVNSVGGYGCSPACSPGFQVRLKNEVEDTCEDIDECSLNLHTCNSGSERCVNTVGSYVCESAITTTTTTIPPLTTTNFSEIALSSDSVTNKVQRDGESQYWYTAPCPRGYRREQTGWGRCLDVNECEEGPGCREHERCRNTQGGYECSPLCGVGWYFNPATKGCQDVDECLLGNHDCPQETHRCVNTDGSFVCETAPKCRVGYTRAAYNTSCVDVDECAENLHDCRRDLYQHCVNREGAFECITRLPSCSRGYEFSIENRRCEDIDECVTGNYSCDVRLAEKCVNVPGSYRCERPAPPRNHFTRQKPACPSGYRYHPRFRQCTDIDECAEGKDICGDEVCYNQPGGYSCSKRPSPMTRRPATQPMPPSANKKCASGTRYVRNRGCVDIDECREMVDACSSNEQCVNTMGSYSCNCKNGFRRDNITQACVDINECQLQNDCLPTQRCDNTVGSYTCVRFLPCGTGYTLNAATEICEDDDECILGTHDCGQGYHCRNTLGSYRCDRNLRVTTASTPTISSLDASSTFSQTPAIVTTTTAKVPITTTTATPRTPRVDCPRGFEAASGGRCSDIDECQRNPQICGRQKCVNTIGSYRCASRLLCGNGYRLDPSTERHCVDIDECAEGSHRCKREQTCENRQGGYVCKCPSGYVESPDGQRCIDVDECSIYAGKVCGRNSRCENTLGSYRCLCEDGFENVAGAPNGICQDVDECQRNPGLCQHVCSNVWGSYRCGCRSGFRLNADNRSCSDIDECTEFKGNNLCIGICENTPGSYSCRCPSGYRLSNDGRTCQDIDECADGGQICRGSSEMCQNTRGGYRCNRIDCPAGYYKDPERKNRCVLPTRYCSSGDLECFRQPSHFSYNYITFVSMLPIPVSTGQLELFTMRGTHLPGSVVQFTMALVDVRAPPGIMRATESCFALRRPSASQAVLVLTRSIAGPQEIELDLRMEIYHNDYFAGSAVAKLFIYVSQYEF